MDLSKYRLEELRNMRDTYKTDLQNLKSELKTIEAAIKNETAENQEISRGEKTPDEENIIASQAMLRDVTKIEILDLSVKPVKNENSPNTYFYTYKARIVNLFFDVEYESNFPHIIEPANPADETLTKLNIKITRPNLQSKLQKGIEFFQQYPNNYGCAMLFLRSVSDLVEIRSGIIKKLYEYEKNLNIGISKNTEQHTIIFKSDFDNVEYLHVKWNFKWEPRTGLARDLFTCKIMHADEQLMGEIKPLTETLCSDKFTFDSTASEKLSLLHMVLTAIKDADTRNMLS